MSDFDDDLWPPPIPRGPVSLDEVRSRMQQMISQYEGGSVVHPAPVDPAVTQDICFWCEKACGGTCLGVNTAGGPVQMRADDPAYWMLKDGHTSTPVVFREDCYICRDPEFAQMGLPLCRKCPICPDGHVPADDEVCTDCGANEREHWEDEQEKAREGAPPE